jgi:hypothetical protein
MGKLFRHLPDFLRASNSIEINSVMFTESEIQLALHLASLLAAE